MKLFKYKSLNGEGLLFALDMIVNKRIYLSTCEMMDDPHEGGFEVTNQCKTDNEDISFLDELKSVHEIVNKTRFTSFSTKADNPLLWAHYAGGYTGIAFEYDIPDNSSVLDLLPIEYSGEIGISREALKKINTRKKMPYEFGILRRKKKEWIYENEYRIYQKNGAGQYVEDIAPTSVILGARNSKYDDVFNQICRKYNLKIGYLLPRDNGYEIYYPE